MAQEGGAAFAPLAMLVGGARPEYGGSVPAGEGSFAQVILTGFLTASASGAHRAGTDPEKSGVDNF
jgi:hypothetical protein